ncbi:hypothetical protein [Chryseolinea soli]|uniref:STAS/SEC14 domain-containing protein n=1 Tax=Chryseolinea soli TaxID=2321403 RepID=A0A385SPL2_9BACT|nr:hypothetical protein [Chryseolinea soli]AYB31895.1 hypothetical protein D4L85_15570 [Chryseolinea soli]
MNNDSIATKTNTEFIYQTEGSILIARFHGFQKPDEAAKDNQVLDQTIRQKRVRALLINQRNIKVLSGEMQSLILDNAAKVVDRRVKRVAIVMPEDVFALAAVSKIHSQSKIAGVAVQLFSSEPDAVEWLRKS